jgi:hypothetical protein
VDFFKTGLRSRQEDGNPFLRVELKDPEFGQGAGVVRIVVKVLLPHILILLTDSDTSEKFCSFFTAIP